MVKRLAEGREERPEKAWRFRPLRMGLIAACVCLALVGTAGAATFAVRQANIRFFDSWDELWAGLTDGQMEDDDASNILVGEVDPQDYSGFAFIDMDLWWNGEPGQTLVDEVSGADGDGWAVRRTFRQELNGQTCLTAKYKAEEPSGFDGLWDGWDTAWLEGNYTAVPGHVLYELVQTDGKPSHVTAAGEFRGQGGAIFSMQYNWVGGVIWEDENILTTNLDHTETYTTVDNVDATIMTATSPSGKGLFWVSAICEHGRLSMFGTQVELDELHTILDSLNLSALLEYTPVG